MNAGAWGVAETLKAARGGLRDPIAIRLVGEFRLHDAKASNAVPAYDGGRLVRP